MVYPFVANKVEQLELDPTKKIDGYVWYNTVEKVYKTWVGDDIQIFITDFSFANNVDEMVQSTLDSKQFVVSFEEAYSVTIKHNKSSYHFVYSLFDSVTNEQIHTQMEILNDNEVKIDFIDPVSAKMYMLFQ